jgi:hypothetical protein
VTDRTEVVTWLSGLTEKQLAEVLHEARPKQSSDSRIVLALARRGEDEPWEISLVGRNADGESWADDAPLCHEGSCFQCDSRVTSWAKRMICPVCENELQGT